jgi:hypothetical protein
MKILRYIVCRVVSRSPFWEAQFLADLLTRSNLFYSTFTSRVVDLCLQRLESVDDG